MSFFRPQLKPATATECSACWDGGKPGEFFRCGFCGYKFQEGDLFRGIYTNDLQGAGGNPLVCRECDAETSELRKRWQEKWAEWRTLAKQRFWWFARER